MSLLDVKRNGRMTHVNDINRSGKAINGRCQYEKELNTTSIKKAKLQLVKKYK